MNALIRKEIRLLLPAWAAALVLAVVPAWVIHQGGDIGGFLILFVWAGLILLATSTFGREFALGTFPLLIVQPVPRERIWRSKVAVLAIATGSILAAYYISWNLRLLGTLESPIWWLKHPVVPENGVAVPGFLKEVVLLALVAFAGGLWTTLLLRHNTAAFCFTLLIPAAVLVVIAVLPSPLVKNDDTAIVIACAVLALYSIAGFLFARRLFLRAQDTQWTGGIVSLPAWRGFARQTVSSVRRPRYYLFALFRKEFQLQQISLLLAGILAILYLIAIGVLNARPALFERSLGVFLGYFWALWLAISVVVGSTAVAEERKLGTLEAHLCLPVMRRVQILIKFVVALVMAILLSTVLPWILEELSTSIGASLKVGEGIFGVTYLGGTLTARVVFSGILVVLSFYTSIIARNTLQALGIASVVGAVSGFVLIPFGLGTDDDFFLRNPPRLWAYLIGLPVSLTTLIWLGHANYRRLFEGGKVWRRNLIVVSALLIATIVAANVIYYRAWELVLPLEPPHGPPRLAQSQSLTFKIIHQNIAVHLPDGRVWLDPVATHEHSYIFPKILPKPASQQRSSWFQWPVSLNQERFVTGSNWTEIAENGWLTIGIQSDGSLWRLRTPFATNIPAQPLRIGSEADWAQVAGLPGLRLKKNGSLWGWGTNQLSRTNLQEYLSAPPFRIGSESDWAEVFQCGWQACARKQDGRVWGWEYYWNHGKDESRFDRRPDLDGNVWVSLSQAPVGEPGFLSAGVQSNGSLWVWFRTNSMEHPDEISVEPKIQIGKDHLWKAAAINGWSLLALERNGTLWKWEEILKWEPKPQPSGFGHDMHLFISVPKPVQLGKHSDWVAITAAEQVILSLAADGSIWCWRYYRDNPLFVTTRRPEKIANIFIGSP